MCHADVAVITITVLSSRTSGPRPPPVLSISMAPVRKDDTHNSRRIDCSYPIRGNPLCGRAGTPITTTTTRTEKGRLSSPLADLVRRASPASVCVYTLSQSAPRRGGVRGSRRATSPPQGRGLILDPCTRLLASSTPTSTEPWRQNVARQIDSYSCGLVQSDVDVHPSVLSVLQAVASASALPKELSAWQAEARCQGKQEQDARAKQDVLVNVLVAPSSGLLALSAEHRAPSSSELQHRGAGGALLFR